MLRLETFPLEESGEIGALRKRCAVGPDDASAQVALGIALSCAGCTYEAAAILRPLRSAWKSSAAAGQARFALDAQAWWNKHWRAFAQLKRAGKRDAALGLLGDRAVAYWDLPPLLIHLGDFAAEDNRLELANHLYQRVYDLSQRGLPKMNMAAFEYVAQASLVETLLRSGQASQALERHRAITPNPGNAMAYEMLQIKLLVATSDFDLAMCHSARAIITAQKHRSGFSKTMRLDFINAAPELAPLRQRPDWSVMLNAPDAYLRGR